jgi:nitrate/nitrite transport system substrate-binding protein
MDRRQFLKYTTLATSGFVVAACGKDDKPKANATQADRAKANLDLGKLEKKDLNIGYVALTDAIPLIIAKEQGFFSRYGLNVSLTRQTSWTDIEKGLKEGRFDAAQALYPMPLLAQIDRDVAMISLMVLNLNGGAITLGERAWKDDLRPSLEYVNFLEFTTGFRKYVRGVEKKRIFAVESKHSMDSYNYRYWLGAMGINPKQEIELTEISPSQMIFKLQAGLIDGFTVAEPWNQEAAIINKGFIAYINRDIWQGYPNKILATMQNWAEKNPNTARALVAAVIESCQFCDRLEDRPSISQTINLKEYFGKRDSFKSIPDPFDKEKRKQVNSIDRSLFGKYGYGGFDNKQRLKTIADFNIFSSQKTGYLKAGDSVNYPWQSHAVWLLTQMIRWNLIKERRYPKDADKILDRAYPLTIYQDVAKELKISLPKERMKIEPDSVFIDKRKFDPSNPVGYLNSFEVRI